jgi:hypothetical protein
MLPDYVPITGGAPRPAEPSSQFMMRCLLSTRAELALQSDDDVTEQEVNVYLTSLLCSYGDPRYCVRVGGYLSTYDSTVFERAQHSRSHRYRYTVYKVNADHLLMSIGVFANPEGRPREAIPAPLRRGNEVFVGRAKAYYDFAAAYGARVFGRQSAVCEVLDRLGGDIEKYIAILVHLRRTYLDFVQSLSEGEIFHLQRAAAATGTTVLHDEFLDRWSAWKRDPTPEARRRLLETVERLRRVDPEFQFDMP